MKMRALFIPKDEIARVAGIAIKAGIKFNFPETTSNELSYTSGITLAKDLTSVEIYQEILSGLIDEGINPDADIITAIEEVYLEAKKQRDESDINN